MATATAARDSKLKICIFGGSATVFDLRPLVNIGRSVIGDKARDLIALWKEKQEEFAAKNPLPEKYVDFWHLTGEALDEAMASLKIKNAVLRARLMQAYAVPAAFPKVKEVITKLKDKGVKTAVLCNSSKTMLTGMLNRVGLMQKVDHFFSSFELEGYKPNSKIYQKLAEVLKLAPQEICYVATDEADLVAAQKAGFKTVAVNPEAEEGSTSGHNLTFLEDVPELFEDKAS